MVRPTVPFRSVAVVACTALAAVGCGGGSGDETAVEQREAASVQAIVFVNGLTVDVSIVPGIGTASESRIALPGESVRAISDAGVCVGVGRNGAVTRIASVVRSGMMTVGTPAKCTDPGLGEVVVTWSPDELSGTRQLDSVIPGTQLCLERRGALDVEARIVPAGTAC